MYDKYYKLLSFLNKDTHTHDNESSTFHKELFFLDINAGDLSTMASIHTKEMSSLQNVILNKFLYKVFQKQKINYHNYLQDLKKNRDNFDLYLSMISRLAVVLINFLFYVNKNHFKSLLFLCFFNFS